MHNRLTNSGLYGVIDFISMIWSTLYPLLHCQSANRLGIGGGGGGYFDRLGIGGGGLFWQWPPDLRRFAHDRAKERKEKDKKKSLGLYMLGFAGRVDSVYAYIPAYWLLLPCWHSIWRRCCGSRGWQGLSITVYSEPRTCADFDWPT